MKIAITGKREITSKKGDEYVIYDGVTKTGKPVQAFLNSEQVRSFGLPNSIVPTKEQIEKVFAELPVVDFEFNEQGRVENITLP